MQSLMMTLILNGHYCKRCANSITYICDAVIFLALNMNKEIVTINVE